VDSLTLKLVNLDIDRGRDVLTVAVPEHEIRVLRAVHGDDKVRRSAEQEGDEEDFDASADAEYDRLTRKYHRVNSADLVRIAYPNGAMQLQDFGFSMGREGASKPPAALVVKHPKPSKLDPAPIDAAPEAAKATKAGK
jgi:hypothetical protein